MELTEKNSMASLIARCSLLECPNCFFEDEGNMVKKSSRYKKRERTKKQKKSSWGAVLVSFLKELFLNFSGPGRLYYDENLTEAGKKGRSYFGARSC